MARCLPGWLPPCSRRAGERVGSEAGMPAFTGSFGGFGLTLTLRPGPHCCSASWAGASPGAGFGVPQPPGP